MIKVALCGIGRMGSYHLAIHEKLAAENEDIRIVAICDVEAHKLSGGGTAKVNLSGAGIASHYNDYRHYTDYDEMLRSESLDFVDITLPTYLHCDAAVKALEKGIHCLCEKPMALSPAECARMADAATRSGRFLMIGHCLRFWREYVYLKHCVESGVYGQVRGTSFWRGSFQDHVKNPSWQDWIITKEKGGGALFDQHIHDIDAVRWLFGAPEAVSVCARTVFPKSANDIVSAAYHYGDKVVTALDDITYKGVPFSYGYKVNFEQATLEYRDNVLKVYAGDGTVFTPAYDDALTPSDDAYYNEIRYFYDCVRSGRKPDAVPLSDSAAAVSLALAETESAARGGAAVVVNH